MANKILNTVLFTLVCIISINAQASKTIFILDGSGSMWGKLGDDTKIEIARNVLKDAIKSIDGENLGLFIYGHRRKSDCSDIEMVFTPGSGNQALFNTAIDQINPTGKTPLARSAMEVIEYLKTSGARANVILITDGIETCEGDLCNVIKEAKEAGVDFILHIVGFGLGDEDRKSLECAAQAGGGMYMDADDEIGLSEAIEASKELKVEDVATRLSVECIKDGQLVDALIEVFDSEKKDRITQVRSYTSVETNPALLGMPYGKYDIKISIIGEPGIPAAWMKGIEINVDTVRKERVDFTAGLVEILITDNENLHDATINIHRNDTGDRVEGGRSYNHEKSNPAIYNLSPGDYKVLVKSVSIKGEEIEQEIPFNIKSKETTNVKSEFHSGTLSVGVQRGEVLTDAIVSIVSLSTGKTVVQGRTYKSPQSNPKTFKLSPGKYKIIAKVVKSTESEETQVEIAPGKNQTIAIRLK
jgi:Ca-activated chloride channel family protein